MNKKAPHSQASVKKIATFLKGYYPNEYDPNKSEFENVEQFRYKLQQEFETNQSTEWPTGTNVFLDTLTNVVTQQMIPEGLMFKNHWKDYIGDDLISVSAFVQVLTTQIPEVKDYDASTYYVTDGSLKLKTLQTFLKTQVRKWVGYEISERVIAGAFTSIPQLASFMANYTTRLPQAMQVFYQNYASANFPQLVVNTKQIHDGTSQAPTPVEFREGLFRILEDLAVLVNPTKNFAGGYQPGADGNLSPADQAKALLLTREYKDLNLIMHPTLAKRIELRINVLSKGSMVFDFLGRFRSVIPCNTLDLNTIIVADKYFWKLRYRIRNRGADQIWAANMSLQKFIHNWFVWGFLPWMVARKYTINWKDRIVDFYVKTVTDTAAVLKGSVKNNGGLKTIMKDGVESPLVSGGEVHELDKPIKVGANETSTTK